jgi:hypothetical protein
MGEIGTTTLSIPKCGVFEGRCFLSFLIGNSEINEHNYVQTFGVISNINILICNMNGIRHN